MTSAFRVGILDQLDRWRRPRALAFLPAALALVIVLLAAAANASAASCSAAGCTGQDPYATGCGADQSVAGSAPIVDSTGRTIGKLTLYWSAACHSNWGSAAFNDGNPASTPPVDIKVVGSNKSTYDSGPVDFSYTGSGSPVWGNMVYSPGCAYATVTRGDATARAVQEGCAVPGKPPASKATCSGVTCQGLDPYQTGCGNDEQAVGSAPIIDGHQTIGKLTLFYSATCTAVWGSAAFDDGNPASTPPVDIMADGKYPSDYVYSGSGSPVWGNMSYDADCPYATVVRGQASAEATQDCSPPAQPHPTNGQCPDSPGAGDNVTRWRPIITCVLALLKQPTSWVEINDVFTIISYESSGNPRAINLYDSNARAGDPSRGLMQTIYTTFERWRNRSWSNDIYDPRANIYAGINYAIHRYGSIPAVPGVVRVNDGGSYVGYAVDARAARSKGGSFCKVVAADGLWLSPFARGVSCARARKLIRAFARAGQVQRRLGSAAPDVLSRVFRLRGFRCKFKRFNATEIARLDLTTYWVGCLAGNRRVTWSARPPGTGKNPAARIVKSSGQTR